MTKFIEVKSANVSGIFEVVANRGVCWQVRDTEDDSLFLVQKKQVVRGPWEETEDDDQPAPPPLLTAALAQVQAQAQAPAPKKERVKRAKPASNDAEPKDPVVSLKELCFDLDIIPRIARRRLRKALGQVGTGSRWEWPVGSQDLEKVKQVLLAKTEPESDDTDDAE